MFKKKGASTGITAGPLAGTAQKRSKELAESEIRAKRVVQEEFLKFEGRSGVDVSGLRVVEEVRYEDGEKQVVAKHVGVEETPQRRWKKLYKYLIIVCFSFLGVLGPLSSTVYIPSLKTIQREFDCTDLELNLTITLYTSILAVAPLIWGQISDRTGRKWIGIVVSIAYVITSVFCFLSWSIYALMAFRMLQAMCVSAAQSVGAGMVSDLFELHERGSAMGIFGLSAVVAPLLGPTIGGLISEYLSWRFVFLFLAIYGALIIPSLIFVVPETHVLLTANRRRNTLPILGWGQNVLSLLKWCLNIPEGGNTDPFLNSTLSSNHPSIAQMEKRQQSKALGHANSEFKRKLESRIKFLRDFHEKLRKHDHQPVVSLDIEEAQRLYRNSPDSIRPGPSPAVAISSISDLQLPKSPLGGGGIEPQEGEINDNNEDEADDDGYSGGGSGDEAREDALDMIESGRRRRLLRPSTTTSSSKSDNLEDQDGFHQNSSGVFNYRSIRAAEVSSTYHPAMPIISASHGDTSENDGDLAFGININALSQNYTSERGHVHRVTGCDVCCVESGDSETRKRKHPRIRVGSDNNNVPGLRDLFETIRNPVVSALCLAQGLTFGSLYILLIYTPIVLDEEYDQGPGNIGLMLLPYGLVAVLATLVGGKCTDILYKIIGRVGHLLPFILCGFVNVFVLVLMAYTYKISVILIIAYCVPLGFSISFGRAGLYAYTLEETPRTAASAAGLIMCCMFLCTAIFTVVSVFIKASWGLEWVLNFAAIMCSIGLLIIIYLFVIRYVDSISDARIARLRRKSAKKSAI